MPFTPFHLGPGVLFKAIGGPRFSFMVFGGAQVLMDIEPLLGLLGHWPAVHGASHTVPGALVIGTIAGAIGRPVSARVLRWLRVPHAPFTWTASFVGAYVGTFSHVLFDALMHSDMSPAWPFAGGNPLLGQVGTGPLHLACMLAGVVGALGVALRCRAGRKA
ncbi:hypothetical protein H4F99_14070 [Lysobacter sp. SG-8]|uniref:DUF4184 family protein n=1 Tax=Marilutibacter penaei TaxID=2759900 RepID=A0A7W3U615_9GAMM|nr:hypothetical protein [Lysobacter penaei]MBB1089607.1 hypothetical protein [Lysobacter penaei]